MKVDKEIQGKVQEQIVQRVKDTQAEKNRHESQLLGSELKNLCIVDRFEGNWAVVEFEGQSTFNFPRSLLPVATAEGDVLRFQVAVDRETTEQRRREIEELSKRLFVEETDEGV